MRRYISARLGAFCCKLPANSRAACCFSASHRSAWAAQDKRGQEKRFSMQTTTPNRVCIIGAGSSGIAACKVLKERGIPFDCFEASDRVGGNWAYDNPNGMSSAYKSLFINTSKPRMEYSDYPMPKSYPVFPHHTQIAEYFNNYVDHFHFRQHIHFNCLVTQAEPLPGGGWEITLQDGSTQRYRALMVANGHHWDPR